MSNAYVGTFKLGESVPMEFSVQFKTVPATLYAPGTWVAIDLTEGDANGYTYLKLYKGNSAVETTGVDWLDYVTVDFDGLTGQVVLAIATAATDHEGFFAEGQHYRVALKTVKVANALGYADGVTQWVGSFGLRQLTVDIDKINGTAVPNTSGKLWVLDNDGENAGQAAIVANLLDYWAKKGIDVSFLNGAALNSMSAKMVSKNINAAWETHDNTTESLEALRDRVDAIELASSVTIGTPAGDSMSADIAAAKAAIDTANTGIDTVGAAVATRAAAATALSTATWTESLATSLGISIYHADVAFRKDANTTQDEYTAQWYKDGVPLTIGITLPKIQVVKRADGTDLVAAAAMTQIGSTGRYRYDEPTNRMTDGEAAICVLTATIDAATRTWSVPIGRDKL